MTVRQLRTLLICTDRRRKGGGGGIDGQCQLSGQYWGGGGIDGQCQLGGQYWGGGGLMVHVSCAARTGEEGRWLQ